MIEVAGILRAISLSGQNELCDPLVQREVFLYRASMSKRPQHSIAAVVLAAGRSTRMGKPKLLMPFRGEPLIMPVLRAAQTLDAQGYPLFWPIVVVTAPHSSPELRGVLAHSDAYSVIAPHADEGMSHSLRVGVDEVLQVSDPVPPAGICVLLGDQPLVDGGLLTKLRDAFLMAPDSFIVPMYQGQRGNPVIIPASCFHHVGELRGDTGARSLFLHAKANVCTIESGTSAVVVDVDTPEAYRDLCLTYGR